jgi:insulysin
MQRSWSQFFSAPLFDANSTSKELNAVDAEHAKNLRSDAWRAYALMKNTANPASVFYRFGTGDRSTLETTPRAKGIDVRAALFEFHDRFYLTPNMKLCVLGRDPLSTLRQTVEQLFQDVPSTSAYSNDPRPPYELPFDSTRLNKLVRFAPVADIRRLTLLFQVRLVQCLQD